LLVIVIVGFSLHFILNCGLNQFKVRGTVSHNS